LPRALEIRVERADLLFQLAKLVPRVEEGRIGTQQRQAPQRAEEERVAQSLQYSVYGEIIA
jgi:hypothetical protein